MAKSGQPLPPTLPPNLVPLMYRRARQGSFTNVAPAPMPMMGQMGGPPMSPTLVKQPSVDEVQLDEFQGGFMVQVLGRVGYFV